MKTKVYGTIGPSCCDEETLRALFDAGMTGIRVNLSHSDLKDAEGWIYNIRAASGKSADILIDLVGPELRIGSSFNTRKIEEGMLEKVGVMTLNEKKSNSNTITVPEIVFENMNKGQEVLIDDGKLLLTVEKIYDTYVDCRVIRGGILVKGKSIALPGVEIYPPTLTESDINNILHINQYGITGVMLPFVRDRQDLMNLRKALKFEGADDVRVFAKIENLEGVRGLPEFLDLCDEVVIARGDLGNAVPLWELPILQDKIASLCRNCGKDFMVVTQMLASMENSKVPTRAEVSDIFGAVKSGASSVMLTGETAIGRYPVESMKYMVNTVKASEKYIKNYRLE